MDWRHTPDSLTGQGRRAVPVTPNDNADLPHGPCKALWVVEAGTVRLVDVGAADNSGVDWGDLPVGTMIRHQVRRVLSTGTGATLLAIY